MKSIIRLRQVLNHLLLAFLLAISFHAKSQEQAARPVNVQALVDSLNLALNQYYVLPDKAKLITAHLQSQYKKNVYSPAADPAKLARQLQNDISSIHTDLHLKVSYDPALVLRRKGKPKPAEEEVKQIHAELKKENYLFRKIENLPGNIGYLRFDGFVDSLAGVRPTIFSAFQFLSNSKALIIDMRYNGGGSPQTVTDVESFFFKEKTHMNSFVDRNAKDTTRFYTDPVKAGLTLPVPVYILTSKRTFSGAEIFAYDMQSARRAVLIGETTAGGAHPVRVVFLGQGFTALVPDLRAINPYTQTNWEGTGVKPDVPVAADNALQKAQEIILKDQLANTPDETEKRKVQWQINTVLVNDTEVTSAPVLNLFTGTFGEPAERLKFFLDKNKLFCTDRTRTFELKALTDERFLINEYAQVEFIKNKNGSYSEIKLLFNDGGIRIVKKNSSDH